MTTPLSPVDEELPLGTLSFRAKGHTHTSEGRAFWKRGSTPCIRWNTSLGSSLAIRDCEAAKKVACCCERTVDYIVTCMRVFAWFSPDMSVMKWASSGNRIVQLVIDRVPSSFDMGA